MERKVLPPAGLGKLFFLWANFGGEEISITETRPIQKSYFSYPQIFAVPEDGAVMPVSMLNRVVFPAPLCPKMAVISLG